MEGFPIVDLYDTQLTYEQLLHMAITCDWLSLTHVRHRRVQSMEVLLCSGNRKLVLIHNGVTKDTSALFDDLYQLAGSLDTAFPFPRPVNHEIVWAMEHDTRNDGTAVLSLYAALSACRESTSGPSGPSNVYLCDGTGPTLH